MFTIKSDDSQCMFTVVVRKDAMPDYYKIIKLPLSEQKNKIDIFLDKGIAQFIGNSEIITPSKKIAVGNYIGRDITYGSLDNSSGKKNWLYTNFFFANNTLYIIQCTMKEKGVCEDNKNVFELTPYAIPNAPSII